MGFGLFIPHNNVVVPCDIAPKNKENIVLIEIGRSH